MQRVWKLNLSLDRAAAESLHLQLVHQLTVAIRQGRLPGKALLPGTRELAQQLGINRKTVVEAYDELVAQGWLVAEGRRGTRVAPALLTAQDKARGVSVLTATPPQQAQYALHGPSWSEPAPSAARVIEFSDGVPDSRLIPFDVLGRAYRRALISTARAGQLAYGDPRGQLELRAQIAAMLNLERGLSLGPQQLCVVRGSQMGIYVAARVLVQPGDVVAMDALTYPPARAAFIAAGARIVCIEQDAGGMRPEHLEALCQAHAIKAVYLTPHHQFPTTTLLSAERRLQVLALAARHRFAVVEDDYDHEFQFAHHPTSPMASAAPDQVVYIGSLSKVLAPGLRVGYIAGPTALIERCAAQVMAIDRQGNAVTELAVADLMQSGELKRHIRRTLRIYQQRRAEFEHALRQYVGGQAQFDLPDGGLALWLRLPDWLDMARLQHDALALGVRVPDSASFAADQRAVHGLRLGFGPLQTEQLWLGAQRLGTAMGRQNRAAT